MVDNISQKILEMERKLPKPKNSSNSSIVVPTTPSPEKIRVISTYGSDSDLLEVVKAFESTVIGSPSFTSTPEQLPSSSTSKRKGMFQLVKRTGASLRNKLVKNKQRALSVGENKTTPCRHKNCQCCRLILTKLISMVRLQDQQMGIVQPTM